MKLNPPSQTCSEESFVNDGIIKHVISPGDERKVDEEDLQVLPMIG